VGHVCDDFVHVDKTEYCNDIKCKLKPIAPMVSGLLEVTLVMKWFRVRPAVSSV
jgi:hypothetical protein